MEFLRRTEILSDFPSPFEFEQYEPITLVELRMRYFSGKIRSKPNWWDKVKDADIAARWRQEIVDHDRDMVEQFWGGEERYEYYKKKWPRERITDAQLDYIFAELKHVADQRDPDTGIFVGIPDCWSGS